MFIPGDEINLPFFIEQTNEDGSKEIIDISEVSGVMYETKTSRVIETYKNGTANAPVQVDSKTVLFTIASKTTLTCTPNVDYSFDIWVGSVKTTFLGILGPCGDSPIKKIVHE
jgi:hypothetical protein